MISGFEGIRIIEVGQFAAGPRAGRILADWGADVIHIEHPTRPDGQRNVISTWMGLDKSEAPLNFLWDLYNSNKRAMTLDLGQEQARQIMYKLIKTADVFITNVRLPDIIKFGCEYERLSQINPRLIYACLTGYGTRGPDKDLPGFDHPCFFARTGILHMMQEPGAGLPPPKPRPAHGDNPSGLALAGGIAAALFIRERTGQGQQVEVSLMSTGIYSISHDITEMLNTGKEPKIFPRSEVGQPLANYYQTKDGRWIYIGVVQADVYWPRLCGAINRKDLELDPRFTSSELIIQNKVALIKILDEIFLTRTLSEWKPVLDATLPWSTVQNLEEVIKDPQVKANELFVSVEHPGEGTVRMVSAPIRLSKTPVVIRNHGPEFSQHTEEILLEAGYSWDDINLFKEQHVIA